MNKTELENAIKNGESVWFADNCNEKVWEIDLNEKYKPEIYLDQILYVYQNINNRFKQELFIENIYKTKAEAEHYLNHANVERVEKLPFLTWEEFKEGKELRFYNGKYRYKMNWSVAPEIIVIKRYLDFDIDEFIFNERLTEANFYKAYDECVRLFKGEE